MPMRTCPCGFDGAELGWYSLAWYRAHEVAHLAAFPDLDESSREILREDTQSAEQREAVSS